MTEHQLPPLKKVSLFCFSLLFVVAGINHFIHPLFYKKIMPAFIPWHMQMIFVSGVAEILLGLFIIPLITRKAAAWGIMILLVLVFPANINMMLIYVEENKSGSWLTILRLPLQLVLIWWAYTFRKY